MTQMAQRLDYNSADALARGYMEALPYFFERVLGAILETNRILNHAGYFAGVSVRRT